MPRKFDASTFREFASLKNRYERQLQRLRGDGLTTDCIEVAVKGAIKNLSAAKRASLVIYGDPQSGKTEMMICLTAKLLDAGTRTIVHLMNDSVDLLNQNLQRFKSSGLAPAALSSSELFAVASKSSPTELVVLCKKNAKDLDNLKSYLDKRTEIIVIDDEADYATPNAKVNKGAKTKINELIEQLSDELAPTSVSQRRLQGLILTTLSRMRLRNGYIFRRTQSHGTGHVFPSKLRGRPPGSLPARILNRRRSKAPSPGGVDPLPCQRSLHEQASECAREELQHARAYERKEGRSRN